MVTYLIYILSVYAILSIVGKQVETELPLAVSGGASKFYWEVTSIMVENETKTSVH